VCWFLKKKKKKKKLTWHPFDKSRIWTERDDGVARNGQLRLGGRAIDRQERVHQAAHRKKEDKKRRDAYKFENRHIAPTVDADKGARNPVINCSLTS
jgi:hypothetical protein